jgi:hypothetical protein
MVDFAFTDAFIVQMQKNIKAGRKQAVLSQHPCPF